MDKFKAGTLEFNLNTVEIVRKLNNLEAPERVEEAVDLLEKWVKMQNHFVKKDFPRIYLETFLITNKGSVELTKQSLDRLCTFKTLKPDYFLRIIKKETFVQLQRISIRALLPRLTEKHYRVFMFKHLTDEVDAPYYEKLYQFFTTIAEYCKMHDYNAGYVLVMDYRTVNPFTIAARTNLMELKQFYTVMSKGYGFRVKGIHVMTRSKLLEPLITIAKTIIGSKLTERVQLHENLDTLHEAIGKDILPEDYGGKEKCLQALNDEWLDILRSKDQAKFFLDMFEAKTEETRRKEDILNENYIGMPGSFRALSVD